MQIVSSDYLGHIPSWNEDFMVLDIETDGLSHRHAVLLIGLVLFPARRYTASFGSHAVEGGLPRPLVLQLFDDDGFSERNLLEMLRDILLTESPLRIVNFNGSSFDLPFLNARFRYHDIDFQVPASVSVDLMRVARQRREDLGLTSFSLKSVEAALGISRRDTISGAESIRLYERYLATGDPALREAVLLHNRDDIINLVPLTEILRPGQLAPSIGGRFLITQCKELTHFISAELIAPYYPLPDLEYRSHGASFSSLDGICHLRLPIKRARASNRPDRQVSLADPLCVFGLPLDQLSVAEQRILADTDRREAIRCLIDRALTELDIPH